MSGKPSSGENPRKIIALDEQHQQQEQEVVQTGNLPQQETKTQQQEHEKRDQIPPAHSQLDDTSQVLSVSWYKKRSFPYSDKHLVTEMGKKQPSTTIELETPVFENFGQGVIPEAFENDWPLPSNLRHKAFPEPELAAKQDETGQRSGRASRRLQGQEAPVFEYKKSSKVGPNFQVSLLPAVGDAPEDPGGDVLWDPVAADRARASGIHVDQYINSNSKMAFPAKMLTIQSLHLSNYDTAGALSNFISLVNESKDKTGLDPVARISEKDSKSIESLFTSQTIVKDFKAIAKATNQSIDSVLVHYYRWKETHSAAYKSLKRKRRQSKGNDYCEICDDGGILMECELCRQAYHPKCLEPPLEKIPEEEWYCESCIRKSPARVRSLHRRQSSGAAETSSPRSKTARPVSVRNVRRKGEPDPYFYEVLIPLSNKFGSLHISIGEDTRNGNIVFCQYNRAPDGSLGYAESYQIFKALGDAIVAINYINIEGMGWTSAAPLIKTTLQDCQERKAPVRLRMRHEPQPFKPSSLDQNKTLPIAPRVLNGQNNSTSSVAPLRDAQNLPTWSHFPPMGQPYGMLQPPSYPATGTPSDREFHRMMAAAEDSLHRAGMSRMASGRSLERMKPSLPSQKPAVAPPEPDGEQNASDEEMDDDDVQPLGRIEYIKREETSTKEIRREKAPSLFLQYTVRVPVTKEGLHLVLDEFDGVPCVTGYRTFQNGELSPCMKMNPRPFKTGNDQILAIDNIPVLDKTYDEVIDMLLDNKDKRVRVFRMRTRKDA